MAVVQTRSDPPSHFLKFSDALGSAFSLKCGAPGRRGVRAHAPFLLFRAFLTSSATTSCCAVFILLTYDNTARATAASALCHVDPNPTAQTTPHARMRAIVRAPRARASHSSTSNTPTKNRSSSTWGSGASSGTARGFVGRGAPRPQRNTDIRRHHAPSSTKGGRGCVSAVGPLALPRTSNMCVVVAARRHPL